MSTLVDDKLVSAMAGMSEWNYASALDTSLGGKADDSVVINTGNTVIMDTSAANDRRTEEEGPAIFDKSAISRISPRLSRLHIKD